MKRLLQALFHAFNTVIGVIVFVKLHQMEVGWVFHWASGALIGYACALGIYLGIYQIRPTARHPAIIIPAPDEAPPCEIPIPTDYGHGYRARELEDGRWVLWCERANAACDLKNFGYVWGRGERFFTDCIGTLEQIDKVAKEIMAARGVFKQ